MYTCKYIVQKEKISSERQLCGWKCLVDVRGQRSEENGQTGDDRKATVTQITTRYNRDMQNTISEHTTHQTLKQMGYSDRRPHHVPLMSAKKNKRRIQFAQAHQNWTIGIKEFLLGYFYTAANMTDVVHGWSLLTSHWFSRFMKVICCWIENHLSHCVP